MEELLTVQEINLVNDAGMLMVKFHELPQMHPDDESEFKRAVHILQDIILHRAAQRAYPQYISTYTKDSHPEYYR